MEPLLDDKLRLLCSYGGRITPLPPSKSLHYVGGETRLVQVPRGLSFNAFFELLSVKLLSRRFFSLKYKLPGYDLDSLITVSDKEDLQNMIEEYDLTRFRRIRLFLFPLNHPNSMSINCLLGLSFNSKLHEDATFEEKQEQDQEQEETPITSVSLLPPENAAVLDKETEKEEIQDQPRPIVHETLPQQQQHQGLIVYYVPVLAMQPHTLTHQVAAPYTLSPAVEHSSRLDPTRGDHEDMT